VWKESQPNPAFHAWSLAANDDLSIEDAPNSIWTSVGSVVLRDAIREFFKCQHEEPSFVDPVMKPLIRLLDTTQSSKGSFVPAGRSMGKGNRREKRHVYRNLAMECLLGMNQGTV
jgi:hypothetical protein